jgi:hypothetical protein
MRSLTAKFMVAGVLCATMALGAPAAAFADSNSTTTTVATITTQPSADWSNAEMAFTTKRHNIQVNYRNTVNSARSSFVAAISRTRNPHARKIARTILLDSIAIADAAETSALANLGNGPEVSGELDYSDFLIERQAINQDYADAVDAQQATYRAEVAAATNSAQMVTARANLKLGIAMATLARSARLVALGGQPPKHAKPGPAVTTPRSRNQN